MSSSIARPLRAQASEVWFVDDMMCVRLLDGREIGVPLAWFPALAQATGSQKDAWRLIGNDVGIRWEALDEDLSVAALLEA